MKNKQTAATQTAFPDRSVVRVQDALVTQKTSGWDTTSKHALVPALGSVEVTTATKIGYEI